MARKPEKNEPEQPDHELTSEEQNIIAWREDVLLKAGVGSKASALLASSLSVDLHETLKIKAKGCTDELLLGIMR